MKKYHIATIACIVLVFPVFVYATSPGNSQRSQINSESVLSRRVDVGNTVDSTPMDASGENTKEAQNQIDTFQVRTEKLEAGDGQGTAGGQFGDNRNQRAYENMSIVAQKVLELQMLGDREGGLGEQISQIAQNQNQSQDKVQMELEKLDSRQGWFKSIMGPDYSSIKNIKMEMQQNRVRMEQLEQMKSRLTDADEIVLVDEMIQAVNQENIMLQDKLSQEEDTKSILGWVFRFFIK